MLEQVISILVSFPNGARWNLRNTGGPAKRLEMWMAMCEFVKLGRNRTLTDVIVCWTYTLTDPARSIDYARLYSSIGNPVQEAKVVARKVSGGTRKNGPAQTAEQTQTAKLKAWNHMVPREVILADYYAHLVTNVQGILWEKVGAVLQAIFLRAHHRRFSSIPEHQKWANGLGHSPFDNCPSGQEPATNATGFRGVF